MKNKLSILFILYSLLLFPQTVLASPIGPVQILFLPVSVCLILFIVVIIGLLKNKTLLVKITSLSVSIIISLIMLIWNVSVFFRPRVSFSIGNIFFFSFFLIYILITIGLISVKNEHRKILTALILITFLPIFIIYLYCIIFQNRM